MIDPKVTVLMSVYNGEKYLREAVDSVLRQTFKDFEFLIINDGSTDGTAEILQSYQDPRIRIIDNEKNIGVTKSSNKGLRLAESKYIARMDADDVCLPDRLERQLAAIRKDNAVGMIASWITVIDENKKPVRVWHADRENNSPEEIYYTLFFENCIAHSTVLFKKAIVLKIGGYNKSFRKSGDYELWTRLSKIARIVKIKKTLVARREHEKNTSFDLTNRHRLNEERVFLKNINALLSHKVDSQALFSIKHNNSTWRIRKHNILNVLSTLNDINGKIVETAPFFLKSEKLKKCGRNKRNEILKNSFPIKALKVYNSPSLRHLWKSVISPCPRFVMARFLLILRYVPEYIDFFFSFKQRCSLLNVSQNKKNILCIVPFLVVGGAERVVINIAKGTDREKFSFHIITTEPANNVWYNKFHSHFENIVMPVKRVASENICNKYFRRLIERLNIDIVLISKSLVGYRYLPRLKSEFKHIKTIDVLHAEESFGARPELEWAIPYLDRRICISAHLKERMVDAYRMSGIEDSYAEKLAVIHNGVDTTQYDPDAWVKGRFKSRYEIPDGTKIISFVGRFSREKNALLFVDIVRTLVEKLPHYELRFIMAGDGPELGEVRNLINKYGIENYFILTGMIDNILELLADTYVLLIVSRSEGIPFLILEAMAMKVPVISTNVGAIHEVIKDGINGYLMSKGNNVAESFACRILDLLSGKQSYKTLAEKARKTIVSKYSLETMGIKYQNIFGELTSEDCD